MDFEFAEQRLKREQSKLRSRQRPTISAKAQREAEYRRKQQAEMKRKREEEAAQRHYVLNYYNDCNRALKVRSLDDGDGLRLRATSIHGDGDKIALPPSVLERLTSTQEEGGSSPWTFRIGVINPEYNFPASPAFQTMKPVDEDDNDGSDEDDDDNVARTAFLQELSYQYIAYAHATVVEFTQEDGHIGLPSLIAAALLDPKRHSPETNCTTIPATRTRDPAIVKSADEQDLNVDMDANHDLSEKTPGHLAYGAFDVPDVPLKVEMITLPKGKACNLVPSIDAIRNGFFNLQDVKLVMEQSLVRTRATLSIGDTVSTWHRGKEFALTVKSVIPADFGAVSCINTDMEVDFGVNTEYETEQRLQQELESAKYDESRDQPLGGAGRTLSEVSPTPMETEISKKAHAEKETNTILRPEPAIDQRENVCTVQIRGDVGSGRRRFDVQENKIEDLFAFAKTLTSALNFNLVTRFPRRIISQDQPNQMLGNILAEGSQEVLMIEKL